MNNRPSVCPTVRTDCPTDRLSARSIVRPTDCPSDRPPTHPFARLSARLSDRPTDSLTACPPTRPTDRPTSPDRTSICIYIHIYIYVCIADIGFPDGLGVPGLQGLQTDGLQGVVLQAQVAGESSPKAMHDSTDVIHAAQCRLLDRHTSTISKSVTLWAVWSAVSLCRSLGYGLHRKQGGLLVRWYCDFGPAWDLPGILLGK